MTKLNSSTPESAPGKPVPLDEALHKLLENPDLHVFCHGTLEQETAEATLKEGLHMNQPELWSTVVGFDTTSEAPESLEDIKATIKQWPHRGAKFVIALGVERLQADRIPHRYYLQSIVQYRSDYKTMDPQYGLRYEIAPRFVAGYFDVSATTFVPNPDFDPHYDASLMDTTADTQILREKRPVSVEGLMGEIATVPHVEPPRPLDDTDTTEVW